MKYMLDNPTEGSRLSATTAPFSVVTSPQLYPTNPNDSHHRHTSIKNIETGNGNFTYWCFLTFWSQHELCQSIQAMTLRSFMRQSNSAAFKRLFFGLQIWYGDSLIRLINSLFSQGLRLTISPLFSCGHELVPFLELFFVWCHGF